MRPALTPTITIRSACGALLALTLSLFVQAAERPRLPASTGRIRSAVGALQLHAGEYTEIAEFHVGLHVGRRDG